MMISMSRTNRGMLDPLSAMKINKNIIRRSVAFGLKTDAFFAVGSLMEIDPNGVAWKYGFAEGAEHYPLTGGKMISFLVLYLT